MKKIIALFTAILLVVSLVGCKTKNNPIDNEGFIALYEIKSYVSYNGDDTQEIVPYITIFNSGEKTIKWVKYYIIALDDKDNELWKKDFEISDTVIPGDTSTKTKDKSNYNTTWSDLNYTIDKIKIYKYSIHYTDESKIEFNCDIKMIKK